MFDNDLYLSWCLFDVNVSIALHSHCIQDGMWTAAIWRCYDDNASISRFTTWHYTVWLASGTFISNFYFYLMQSSEQVKRRYTWWALHHVIPVHASLALHHVIPVFDSCYEHYIMSYLSTFHEHFIVSYLSTIFEHYVMSYLSTIYVMNTSSCHTCPRFMNTALCLTCPRFMNTSSCRTCPRFILHIIALYLIATLCVLLRPINVDMLTNTKKYKS